MINEWKIPVELYDKTIRTLQRYSPREAEIVKKRYKKNMTLQAIGDDYGISRERVRQILNKIENVVVPKIEDGVYK